MRTILVIGIGAGDPDHITIAATKAINTTDVFFVTEQTRAGHDLADVRRDLITTYAISKVARTVELHDPARDRNDPDYEGAVERWRLARVELWASNIAAMAANETGAFLVWGDPALYDSTIWVLDQILDKDPEAFDYQVIPGVSSPSALAAAHRIPWNRVGEPVVISTGRRVAEGRHPHDPDVLVMLDAQTAFTAEPDDTTIFWGAYLGTPDQLLVAGPIREVEAEIQRTRAEARETKGWIMETYLLRRSRTTE